MRKGLSFLSFLLLSCQSTGGGNVSVGKAYPRNNCREVGQVIGSSSSRTNAHYNALEDLRYAAAAKDANYVRILATAAHGASIRGMAYQCH